MENQFVPFDLAMKLKELEYEGETLAYYGDMEILYGNLWNGYSIEMGLPDNKFHTICSAPLWQQAFDFILEKYGYNCYIKIHGDQYQWDYKGKRGKESNRKTTSEAFKDITKCRYQLLTEIIKLIEKKDVSKFDNLKEGDYVAFEWKYGVNGPTIVVDNITLVDDDEVLVHFLYGYKSEAEFVKKENIIAIGDINGQGRIKGWKGNFNILLPDHPLLKDKEEAPNDWKPAKCVDKFDQPLNEGDYVDVQRAGVHKLYTKEKSDELYFQPYGKEELLYTYLSNDIVRCDKDGEWDTNIS